MLSPADNAPQTAVKNDTHMSPLSRPRIGPRDVLQFVYSVGAALMGGTLLVALAKLTRQMR